MNGEARTEALLKAEVPREEDRPDRIGLLCLGEPRKGEALTGKAG